MGHVVKVVGGLESQQVHIGQQGMRFRTVPKAKQVEALQFLLSNAFTVPAFMIRTGSPAPHSAERRRRSRADGAGGGADGAAAERSGSIA